MLDLFHLLVPGGKWHTDTSRPVASATRCSSSFHSRLRGPFEPPASAVASRRFASGYAWRPIRSHQRRTVSAANDAVSWSTPTLTQPLFAVKS